MHPLPTSYLQLVWFVLPMSARMWYHSPGHEEPTSGHTFKEERMSLPWGHQPPSGSSSLVRAEKTPLLFLNFGWLGIIQALCRSPDEFMNVIARWCPADSISQSFQHPLTLTFFPLALTWCSLSPSSGGNLIKMSYLRLNTHSLSLSTLTRYTCLHWLLPTAKKKKRLLWTGWE